MTPTRFFSICLLTLYLVFAPLGKTAHAEAFKILILGDSLTSGYQLKKEQAYPAVLERIMHQYKFPVKIINAGVSGDTMHAGASRLDFHLEDKPHMVIVALGGNDALRGVPVENTYNALEKILKTLSEKKIPTAVMGMKAPPNMGKKYIAAYDSIFPHLAKKYNVPLYPFFLDGIALDPRYNLSDGVHPNAQGVHIMVQKSAPFVMHVVQQLLPQPAKDALKK